MDEIFELFPNKEAFDRYWKENYQPLCYDDVKEAFDKFLKKSGKEIFNSDYASANQTKKEDFKENLSQTAEFHFQEALTEAFYDKNPEVYENAFTLFEVAKMEGLDETIAETFHEEYNRLYVEFLDIMFDENFA